MKNSHILLLPLLAAALFVSALAGLSRSAEALSFAETSLVTEVGDRLFFDFDNVELRPVAIDYVKKAAYWMKQHPEFVFMIEGHADNRGSREYNLELGCWRALATRKALIDHGIAPERLGTVSYGKERPSVLGENEAAWAKNRRAVILVDNSVWTSDCSPPG